MRERQQTEQSERSLEMVKKRQEQAGGSAMICCEALSWTSNDLRCIGAKANRARHSSERVKQPRRNKREKLIRGRLRSTVQEMFECLVDRRQKISHIPVQEDKEQALNSA